MEWGEILVSVSIFISLITNCHSECPNDNWTENNGRCYLFQITEVTHSEAELSCAESGATIASIKDDQSAYRVESIIPSGSDVTTMWSRYLLVQGPRDVVVTNKVDNVTDCIPCNSLKTDFIARSLNISCISIGGITETTSVWNLANCDAKYQVICEKDAVITSVLAVKDIVAIACLVFLVVSFVIVITVDLLKNPPAEDTRVLVEDTRT